MILMTLILLLLHNMVMPISVNTNMKNVQKSIYNIAVEYIGKSNLDIKSISDSLIYNSVTLKPNYQDYPPFIRNNKINKTVWIVALDSFDLRSEKYIAMGVQDKYRIDLRVIIDSSTNSLVRIYSLERDCPENAANYPSIEKEELIMGINNIRYYGLYEGIPNIKFMDAIKASSTCAAGIACQVSAELVYYSQGGSKESAYPVWIIQTRGISGGPIIGGDGKNNNNYESPPLYRGRCIILASDGSVIRKSLTNRN